MRYECEIWKNFWCGFWCVQVGKFGEKLLIGKSVDFIWIFVFIYEESGLDYVFGLGCEMGESVDFSGV